MSAHTPSGVVSVRSAYPFAATVKRLRAAFTARGLKVFATIDHQAAAAEAGLQMPPTTVILFGQPRDGTPLMLAQPSVAIDLPSRVLVAEATPGTVTVSINAAEYVVGRHGLAAGFAKNLAPAGKLITDTVTA